MSKKDWSNTGTVRVRDAQGRVSEFDTLNNACRWLGDRCLKLSRGNLGSWAAPYKHGATDIRGYYWGGDSHLLTDELGLIIPVWKVRETYLSLPFQQYQSWPYYSRCQAMGHYRHETDFRNGAVPGISNHWRRSGGSPRLRTTQEIRENDFVVYDEDCLVHEVTVRAARRRPAVPTKWDDKPRARRGRGWKQQDRHTQWRAE